MLNFLYDALYFHDSVIDIDEPEGVVVAKQAPANSQTALCESDVIHKSSVFNHQSVSVYTTVTR
jgi:hypothetical protein